MTKLNEVYKCEVCGNIVQVLHAGVGELVCCGQPMKLQIEKTEDLGQEKHVPVIEKSGKGVKVKVGSAPHPMEESHHIEWIEIVAEGKRQRKFLKAGDSPEAEFATGAAPGDIRAREYCNVHGLWKA